MDLDELQSVQSRERQATSLQNLRATFYQDAGTFVEELREERDRAAERADDPFSSDEVRQLTDDIETAEQTVEAIYERRVGKVVKMASIAAAGMPTEEEGLTDEERRLFDTLVDRIEDNREHVLDEVLDGEGVGVSRTRDETDGTTDTETADSGTADPDTSAPASDAAPTDDFDPAPDPTSDPTVDGTPSTGATDPDPVDAADMMGGSDADGDAPGADGRPAARSSGPTESTPGETDRTAGNDQSAASGSAAPPDGERGDAGGSTSASGEATSVERTTVRITRDVGEIFGVDERSYDLAADDVVTLPEANAEPLVQRDAAEKLD